MPYFALLLEASVEKEPATGCCRRGVCAQIVRHVWKAMKVASDCKLHEKRKRAHKHDGEENSAIVFCTEPVEQLNNSDDLDTCVESS